MLKYKKWHKGLNMAKSSTSLTPHIELLRNKYQGLKESPFYREIQLLLLFLLNILLFICLFSFNPNNDSFYSSNFPVTQNTNFAGKFGSYLSHFLIYQIGFIAFVTPLTLSHVIWIKLKKINPERLFIRLFGWTILLTSLSFVIQAVIQSTLINGTSVNTGGRFGIFLNEFLKTNFGLYGSFIVSFTGFIIGLMLASQKTFLAELQNLITPYFVREKKSRIVSPVVQNTLKTKTKKIITKKTESKETTNTKLPKFSIPEIPENFKQPLLFNDNTNKGQSEDTSQKKTAPQLKYTAPS